MRSDDTIMRELVERALARDIGWPQFRSLAGARQYRHLYRMTRRYVPLGAEVLDWGSGNGHFSYFLMRAGYRPTGFAIEGASQAEWLDEPYVRFVGGSVAEPKRLPFPDRSFDAVSSVGVLEHVRETGGSEAASLTEIVRVLRPGGTFLCCHFPNQTSLIDRLARAVPGKHYHEFRYTRGDIERLARDAGLTLVEAARYGALPRNALSRLPGPLRTASWPADAWDALDAALGALAGPLCQNWRFVARKPAA
ncbi:MAG TPA: class I SAM-dependent methyltransferase [Dongiaceae bacterium]|nr:class I SAM-dependent methyltransferase [Dongiaceae bacterium]